MHTEYSGKLRVEVICFKYEEEGVEQVGVQLTWKDEDNNQVWQETCKPPEGQGFASQVACQGDFSIEHGYFVDTAGKRHLVLQAEVGQLGADVF